MNEFTLVVLLSGVLGTYARFNFLQVFIDESKQNLRLVTGLYILYYVISSLIFVIGNIPILNLVLQIFFMMLIGKVSGLSIKKSLLATSIIIFILVALESLVVFISGYISSSIFIASEYNSILGVVVINLITLMVSKVFKSYKNIRKRIELPLNYWFAVFAFPIASLILLIVIFGLSSAYKSIIISTTVVILIMNFLIFWFYDNLIPRYEKRLDDMAIEHLNEGYRKQLELMRNSEFNIRALKHDFNRHLSTMDLLAKAQKYNDLDMYLDDLKTHLDHGVMISNTGNVIIDSIINYELSSNQVDPKSIELQTKGIPDKLGIRDYDLTIVISNIISNAFIALKKVDEGKAEIKITHNKGIFFMSVMNTYNGHIVLSNQKLLTTKEDCEHHGFGIENVRNTIEKYDGDLKITYDEKQFNVEIMMYEENLIRK